MQIWKSFIISNPEVINNKTGGYFSFPLIPTFKNFPTCSNFSNFSETDLQLYYYYTYTTYTD